MRKDVMVKQLRNVAKKHENDKLYTFDTNISQMCTDVANRLEELEKENKEIRNKAISEFAGNIIKHFADWQLSEDDVQIKYIITQVCEGIEEIVEEMRGGNDND